MFFNAEDDDHDFMSPGKSKLGALFGMDKTEHQGGNESLTYTAPKQPKKKETGPPSKSGSPELMFAGVVNAFKYVDNKYASQGKLGAAILGNHGANEYSILMYVTKQQPVSNVKITPSFVYTTQANNYANFYDDARQSWSILHDSEQNAIQFAKYVCLSKALSAGSGQGTLVTQDLTLGDGGSLEVGDSAELKYTGWLLTNNTFGQVFDTNTNADKLFRFKLGAGKVIKGWESGVLGMKKGAKRFLVVPPNLAYGSQGMGNKVPPNSTLLFEVEVVRVKLVGRESSVSPVPPTVQQPPAPAHNEQDHNDPGDHTVKERTKSITEHIAQSPPGDSSKAKLISRMAKMGKPMLPFSGAVAADPDSDEEHIPESPQPITASPVPQESVLKPIPKPHPHRPQAPPPQIQEPVTVQYSVAQPIIHQQPLQSQPAFLQNLPGAQQVSLYQPQPTLLQQQQALLQQQQLQQGMQPQSQLLGGGLSTQPTVQQAVPGTSLPQYVYPGIPPGQDVMLLSETRQQNTEVRLTLSKVSDKVDQVIQKLDHVQSQNVASSMMPNMETSVLLHNIQRIVQENERLKKDVYEKSGKIDEQNNKISDLLQRNQSYVEKSQTLMEQRSEGFVTSAAQSQSKVLAIEQEKVKLTTDLTEATSHISTLQLEVASLRKKEFELQQQLGTSNQDTRKQTDELEQLRAQQKEDEGRLADLTRSLKNEKQERKMADNNITQLQEELADLKSTKFSLEKNLSERKKKAAEEKRQLEDELDDVKTTFEAEVQSLKERLRKQKTSTNVATAEQISKLEEEITADWKAKSEKLLAVAGEKHARALQTVQEEKFELERNVEELEKKIGAMRSNASGSDQKLVQLQDEIEELSVWKDKYDSLRNSATTMKERYESRIKEMEEEKESLEEQKEEMDQLVPKLREEIKKLQSQGGSGDQNTNNDSQGLLNEVKKIMNTVYKDLREQFEADETYAGSDILAAILNAIKVTTLSLMKGPQQTVQEEASGSEEEEEEAGSDEEEEEEEEEEDSDEEEEEAENQSKTEHQSKSENQSKTENQSETGENDMGPISISDSNLEPVQESSLTPDITIENKIEAQVEQKSNELESDNIKAATSDKTNESAIEPVKDTSDSELVSETSSNVLKEGTDQGKLESSETSSNVLKEGTDQGKLESSDSDTEQSIDNSGSELNKEEISNIPNTTNVPNEIDNTQNEAEQKSDPLSSDVSSLTRQLSSDSLDQALESELSGSDKNKLNNEKVVMREESPSSDMVPAEPPPLPENSDDDNQDDELDFFDSEDKKESFFGDDDDNVQETLGITPKPDATAEPKKLADKLTNDEDMKPKAPPPLFPDDDDDDDLDWLS